MIWTMFFKDCLELLRDKKHLLITIFLPIIITPLLIFGVGYLQSQTLIKQATKALTYHLDEQVPFAALRTLLDSNSAFEAKDNGSVEAVRLGELDLLITVTASTPVYAVDVTYKETDTEFSKINRLQRLIAPLSDQLTEESLGNLGVDNESIYSALNPIQLQQQNVITNKENVTDLWGNILPFFICLWIIASATGTSSDLVAGEKERGTLETLLITPIPLNSLIGGKWLVLTFFSWMTGILTFLSLWFSLVIVANVTGNEFITNMVGAISIGAIIGGIIVILPTASLICAVFFVSASISQSFKEAQSYASGLMLIFFIPLIATMSGSYELNMAYSLIPIMNSSLAFSAILQGTFNLAFIIPIFLSNALVSMAILTFSLIMFRSEKVLSRR